MEYCKLDSRKTYIKLLMNGKIHIELFPPVFKNKQFNLFIELFFAQFILKRNMKSSNVLNNVLKFYAIS